MASWSYGGDHDHWLVRQPTKWAVAYHELGHTQQRQEPEFQFSGETEAIVNFLWCYIRHVKFGDAFNAAFAGSQEHDSYTPDQAAVHWMVTQNFREGNPMDETSSEYNEMRYQHRGYAKYADIARLFGWEGFTRAFYLENAAFERGEALPGGDLSGWGNQLRVLRLSIAVGYDLTAFFDFWGVKDITPTPADDSTLSGHMQAHNLGPSLKVRCLLLRYKNLIPADNSAFNSFFDEIYPGRPSGGASPLYGQGWFNAWRDTYSATHGSAAKARIDAILAKHFTGASPDCAGVNTGGPGVDLARPTTYQWLLDFNNGSTSPTAASPSPSPSRPPVSPFAPLGDGEAIVEMQVIVLTATFTVAGDVASIDQSALKALLLELFSCAAPCVLTLTLTPASITVTSQLTVPSSATSSVDTVTAAARVFAAKTPASLGTDLGLTVQSIDPTVGVQTRAATVRVAPPPAPGSSSALGAGAVVGIAVGGVAAGAVVLLCALLYMRVRAKARGDIASMSSRAPLPA